MAGSLTAQLLIKIAATATKAFDLATADYPLTKDYTQLFASGTGANQATQIFDDTRTLGASATEDLDLAGVLTNSLGVSLTFTRLKAICVKAAAANTNNVNVQRATANGVPFLMAALDGISLTPGALFLAVFPDANGVAVTAGTGDLITITNSAAGTSVTYDVILIGTD